VSTMTLHTVSGSTYEVDTAERKIRRLGNTGGSKPTPHTGQDGVWKGYERLELALSVSDRRALVVHWGDGQATRTSLLVPDDEPKALAGILGRAVI
jgi:hypothetical protein